MSSVRIPVAAVTLADLVVVPALAGARVVPPDAELDVPVSTLTLAGGPVLEGAAVLLAPDAPPASLPEGCVAVVCRRAPKAGGATPAIVLPAGAPWGAVLAELAVAITSAGALGHAAAARGAFRTPLVAGRGFAGLAAAARELLAAPVACLDEYLDTLGAAGFTGDEEEELEALVERARHHAPASVLGPFLEEALPGLTRVLVPGPGGAIGVIVSRLPPVPTTAQEATLGELADAFALERAREEVRAETESRLRGDLIEELMAGEAVSGESVVRRARHLGADLSRGAVAMIGKLHDPHTEGRVITDPRLVRRFMRQVRAAMELHWPRALADWTDGQMLALAPPPAGAGAPARDELDAQALVLGRRLIVATRETVPGLVLTLALSRFTAEPGRLGAALDEARLALQIGERLGRIGEVVTFEETGTYKLLFQIYADRPDELRAFYEQTLAPLVRYDEQYGTDLVATLANYLGNDGNLAATAGQLFTHRHTVRYRLDRIAELSGLDIAKTDDREKLSLGLKAMRLLGRRVATTGETPTRRGRGAA